MTKLILTKTAREEARRLITEAYRFKPKNQMNSVYMGGAAQCRLYDILGSQWPDTALELALVRASDDQLIEARLYCEPYIQNARKHRKMLRWEDLVNFQQLSREAYARKYACNKEAVLAGSKDDSLYIRGYFDALTDLHANYNK